MRDFSILFKHELKQQFPRRRKKEKVDVVGTVMSLLISLLVIAIFVMLFLTVAENYVVIRINKVADPTARALELLNLAYLAIIVAMSALGVEKMRKTLSEKKDREVFLRLPVKQQTIFLSKLSVLAMWNYMLGFMLVVPVNLIIYLSLKPGPEFWLSTVLVWLLLPVVSFFIAALIIIPYIKLIDFISHRYFLIFLSLSTILVLAFSLYSGLLSVVQNLLQTGSIKFLFNEEFINFLSTLLVYSYPANLFAKMALFVDFSQSLLIIVAIALVALFAVYLISRGLYYVTLYKNDNRNKKGRKRRLYARHTPLFSLVKKEFITIFRNPSHIFSYFAIATSMPVMVYCCYTLFESLIQNTLGIKVSFALALLVTLIFSMLTNTFCATNVTRDGITVLKNKVLPLNPAKILYSKVLLCSLVSSLAVIASAVLLVSISTLSVFDAAVVVIVGIIFSTAQIFIATRMDLNNARLSGSASETERESNKTIAKVVGIGFVLALVMGIASLMISVFSGVLGALLSFKPNIVFAYIIPVVISVGYILIAIRYYSKGLRRRYENLTV